jgi:hypothetical protein
VVRIIKKGTSCYSIPNLLLLYATDCVSKMFGTTISKIISIDTGQHNVIQTPSTDGFSGMFWLMRIQWLGCSVGLDGTEATSTGTFVAHQHDGRSSSLMLTATPAISNVRASSLLADSV